MKNSRAGSGLRFREKVVLDRPEKVWCAGQKEASPTRITRNSEYRMNVGKLLSVIAIGNLRQDWRHGSIQRRKINV